MVAVPAVGTVWNKMKESDPFVFSRAKFSKHRPWPHSMVFDSDSQHLRANGIRKSHSERGMESP